MKSLPYLIIASFLAFNVYADPIITEEKAISIVKELYLSTIEDAEYLRPNFKVEIEITLLDLNNDNNKEILALLQHPNLCGSQGCQTVILEKTSNGHWGSILSNMITHGDIEVFKEKINGYNTINFGGGPKLKYANGSYAF